jgi:iron complex outermembrane recepter protein
VTPAIAQDQRSNIDFANQSIEQLMNVDVTSVSRKQQKLSKVPAAIYVITQEEIARSGATTIPDVLRMAPGVQVAQVDANRWAISARGFNDIYSNKLLVLVDGRTVYSPSFSGMYWDQIDIPLDTIERIEAIRGSGGTMWGPTLSMA